MFFKRKHRLTELCDRVTLRMLENAAMDDSRLMRAEFDQGSKRTGTGDSDRGWSAWMRDVEHPKRSTIVYLIVSLAAADFWKEANKTTDNPDWGVSDNPFKKTNSDVIVAEALMFFWYNFFLFVRRAARKKQLTKADNQAVSDAATTIGYVIQETTQWSVAEILGARMNEYEHRDTTENPTEVFSRVVLRSIGKQAINDPDRRIDSLGDLDHMPIVMHTTIHMIAKLPAYFDVYKNIIEHYQMD